MNPYNYRWIVKIKKGYFMAGIHRFRTKREGLLFIELWWKANTPRWYSDIPTIEKKEK